MHKPASAPILETTRLLSVIGLTTSPRHASMNSKKPQTRTLLWQSFALLS